MVGKVLIILNGLLVVLIGLVIVGGVNDVPLPEGISKEIFVGPVLREQPTVSPLLLPSPRIAVRPNTLVLELISPPNNYKRVVAYGRVTSIDPENQEIILYLNQVTERFILAESVYSCRLVRQTDRMVCQEIALGDIEVGQFVELSVFDNPDAAKDQKVVQRIMLTS